MPKWGQSSDCTYLTTLSEARVLCIWKLVEYQDTYDLQLVWGEGQNGPYLLDVRLSGVVGLSPANRKLLDQRRIEPSSSSADKAKARNKLITFIERLDGDVRLRDPHNGMVISTLSGYLSGVNSVAYSPTGDSIASGT
ncbi:hypothetical protein BGX29_005792 [Mortierella sp. GBA35]|nr:hypothetical protein BGX29_005792 [Mortierella sp. GBA35]